MFDLLRKKEGRSEKEAREEGAVRWAAEKGGNRGEKVLPFFFQPKKRKKGGALREGLQHGSLSPPAEKAAIAVCCLGLGRGKKGCKRRRPGLLQEKRGSRPLSQRGRKKGVHLEEEGEADDAFSRKGGGKEGMLISSVKRGGGGKEGRKKSLKGKGKLRFTAIPSSY